MGAEARFNLFFLEDEALCAGVGQIAQDHQQGTLVSGSRSVEELQSVVEGECDVGVGIATDVVELPNKFSVVQPSFHKSLLFLLYFQKKLSKRLEGGGAQLVAKKVVLRYESIDVSFVTEVDHSQFLLHIHSQ